MHVRTRAFLLLETELRSLHILGKCVYHSYCLLFYYSVYIVGRLAFCHCVLGIAMTLYYHSEKGKKQVFSQEARS